MLIPIPVGLFVFSLVCDIAFRAGAPPLWSEMAYWCMIGGIVGALLAAVPVPDPTVKRKRIILAGDVPSPIKVPAGCRFHTRCPYAFDRCRVEEPVLKETTPAHWVACHLREAPVAMPSGLTN